MEVKIRSFQLNDVHAINQLSQQLGYPATVKETEYCIKEVLSLKYNVVFVAVVEHVVVGWIHGFKAVRIESQPFIEIGGLVVDKNYRNRQIGKKLVERVKEWCLEKNIFVLRLRSNTRRKEAHQFYYALGFTEIKEQKVFELIVTAEQ
ncbi:MAG: GNAT family N-acetyltransferase [Chitinophagaceae bacterium]|nr:GNAT family N-acetyltransferase [Chitinophagaceae bacterium]